MSIPPDQPILGGPHLTHAAIVRVLTRLGVSAADVNELASAYDTFGTLSTIGARIPLAQAIDETRRFTSARWKQSRNPAGLGATNDGRWGGHFTTIAAGVLAQYAHLLAYAAQDADLPLPLRLLVLIDPRLSAIEQKGYRGVAPLWTDLNGRWAVPGPTYGQAILAIARTLVN